MGDGATARSSWRRWPRSPRPGSWQVVRHLLPTSGQVDELVAAVAAERGRPIRVLGCPLEAAAPSGLWVQTPEVDYLVHADGIAPEHRRLVLCHELAHMVLGHGPGEGGFDVSDLVPSIAPEVAARFFTRHGYEDGVEAAAESLATDLAIELARRATRTRTTAMLMGDTVSARLR